jgi:DNA-binding NarL/FixJ family response regulator
VIKVMLVDDDEFVRTGLRVIIEAQDDLRVVGEAADGAEVVPQAVRCGPDVVLMDVRMPAVDGIQATRLLLRRYPEQAPKVLVLTTFEHDDHVYDALRAGASGFLLKRARPAEVVQAIRVVAAGDSLVFPDAVRRLAAGRGPADGDRLAPAKLSTREAEVLTLMAAGLSNAEIAERLILGVETVKHHVKGVLTKLGARDRTQAVIAAYESGFVVPQG